MLVRKHGNDSLLRPAFALVLLFLMLGSPAAFFAKSQFVRGKTDGRVTLLNRTKTAKNDNWKKAVVSFRVTPLYSIRGPVSEPFQAASNNWNLLYGNDQDSSYSHPAQPSIEPLFVSSGEWDLVYGGLSYNGDRDWLKVNSGRESWSRIRDLGEMDWSDSIVVPILPNLPCPTNTSCGRINIPSPRSGKKINDENLNPHIAKPVAGHMYVIHRKRDTRGRDPRQIKGPIDYYILVRVEELKPNESCTIAWKKISKPKK